MAYHYAVMRSREQDAFVIESNRYESKSEFMDRVVRSLTVDEDKANRLISFSIEFIFGE